MKKIDVINFFGTQEKTAAALGLKQASVSRWDEDIPVRRAFEIEHITNGALKADFNQFQTISEISRL